MMKYEWAKLMHSLSLRMPQAYALRSGLRVYAQTKQQNSLFWSTFTSSEYLSLVPNIIKSDIRPTVFIDCGAATGYVTMLFSHLIKSGILEWQLEKIVCIEPSSFSITVLKANLTNNLLPSELIEGVVGKREGTIDFYESKSHPWSSSVRRRFQSDYLTTRSYFNLDPLLENNNCFLKIDIEGSEYDWISTYQHVLKRVMGIILEWHKEMGDMHAYEKILLNNGFQVVKISTDKDNRQVSLYLRK